MPRTAQVTASNDQQRLRSCLKRFLVHVDRTHLALTGGVAIELHLAARGQRRRREGLADIDFVASCPNAVSPTVVRDFLVSHFHVSQPGIPKSLLQLVDPVAQLRLDVFPDVADSVPHARPMRVAGEPLLVLDAQSLLKHKLKTLAHPPVDEKHWQDAVALAALCGVTSPPRPMSFRPDVYLTDVREVCGRCTLSRSVEFPLAPKEEVFRLLGYV